VRPALRRRLAVGDLLHPPPPWPSCQGQAAVEGPVVEWRTDARLSRSESLRFSSPKDPMYGLPDDIDLSFLEGATLLQVCLGENEVILRFDPDLSITIESTFRARTPARQGALFRDPRSAAAVLVELISDVITKAHGRTDGTLRLSFSRGGVLEIYDDSKQYESYQIQHGKDLYVV
jgi:hypothetical protein